MKIVDLLGGKAEYYLNHTCKTIDKQLGLTLVKHFALLHSGWYFIIVILFSGNSSPHS